MDAYAHEATMRPRSSMACNTNRTAGINAQHTAPPIMRLQKLDSVYTSMSGDKTPLIVAELVEPCDRSIWLGAVASLRVGSINGPNVAQLMVRLLESMHGTQHHWWWGFLSARHAAPMQLLAQHIALSYKPLREARWAASTGYPSQCYFVYRFRFFSAQYSSL